MLKMKRILGILLALCFLISVTAAAASAHEEENVKTEKTVVIKEETFVNKVKESDEDESVFISGQEETFVNKVKESDEDESVFISGHHDWEDD